MGETLPAVRKARAHLDDAVKALQETASAQEKELAEFQQKYKIRVANKGEEEEESDSQAASGSRPAGGQGVLV